MLLSVIIPVYNEEATLVAIIKKVQEVRLAQGLDKEIVLVNDGSNDRTKAILDGFGSTTGMTIVHQSNQGKTAAVLTGIRVSKGDIILIQDADLEYDPLQYPELLAPILNGRSEIVYGSRFLGSIAGMEPINHWANRVSNWTLNLLYGIRLTDINTCYKLFTRRAFEGITIKGRYFDIDTELTVKLLNKGLTIKEVPIRYTARALNEGKKIRWTMALRMYWMIIKHRFIFHT